MRQIQDTPPRIVENGRFTTGVFKTEFRNLNMADADPFSLGGLTPRAIRLLRLKEWQHYAIVHPDFYFGMVILTTHYTANTFFNVFDRRTSRLAEYKRMLIPSRAHVASSLFGGHSHVDERGFKMEFRNYLDKGVHELTFDIAVEKKLPAVRGSFRILEDTSKVQPLIVCLPLAPNRAMYTHKVVCPVDGEIRTGPETVSLDPSRDTALIDVHKSTYPYHFWWKWANFAGFDPSGRILGANLTDNLIKNQKSWNECAIWHGGAISLLDPVEFEFDPLNTMKPWSIHGADGRVDLKFAPEGQKKEELNFGLIRTHYRQPFGKYNGILVDDSGSKHEVRDVFGVAEHMDSHL